MSTNLRTGLLLAALTALLLVAGQIMGGAQGLKIAIIFALVLNVGSYWFSDRIVLSIYHAKQVDPQALPEVYRIVKTLTERAGLPMPKLYLIESDTPNAFATGRNPAHAAVAVTTGILRILDEEELTGVLAHELSHVKHYDILTSSIAATIAGAIAALANMAQWAMIFGRNRQSSGGGNALATILMLILAPLAASLIQLAVSRSREYAADEAGAKLCGHPMWLARALAKLDASNTRNPMPAAAAHPESAHMFIVNPLRGSQFAKLFSTHPPTEERIRRLESMVIP